MARLATLRKGDWDQFDRLLGSTDLTAEEVLRLIKNPTVLNEMLATMRAHEAFRLVHGFYNPVDDIKAAADERVRAAGYDPDKFKWIGSTEPPSFDEDDAEVAVALYETLGTLPETLWYYWQWIVSGQQNHWVWDEFKNDSDHVRHMLDHDGSKWRPRTRQWVKVKLDANKGNNPKWTRDNVDHETIAGLEVMAVYAQHPKSLSSRNGSERPFTNVTAIDYNWEHGDGSWRSVVFIRFDRDYDEAGLSASRVGGRYDDWSCPVLLREE